VTKKSGRCGPKKLMYTIDVRKKNRFSISLFLLLLAGLLLSERSFAVHVCDWAQKNYRQKLSEEADQRDVSGFIDSVDNQCSIPQSEKISDSDKLKFKRRGYLAEAEFILDAAESESNYRDVRNDLEKYRTYMAKANASNFIKTQYVSRLEKRGFLNKDSDSKNCGHVDLRSKFGEVRDQDTIGWCYAFTAADLIGFKTGIRVSAADIAAIYASEMKSSAWSRFFSNEGEISRAGGDEYYAVDRIKKIGLCKEDDFPSEYFAENKDTKDFVEMLEKSSEKTRVQYLTSDLPSIGKSNILESKNSQCRQFNNFGLSQSQLSTIKDVVDKTMPSRALYDLAVNSCRGKRISADLPNLDFKWSSEDGGPKAMIGYMDSKLNSNLPIAITWHPEFSQGNRRLQKGTHASIVVGRRLNETTGKCEYLVRNSWGKSCNYVAELSCEAGNVWIPREMAHQVVERVVSFEK